jgi:four helix bundle protein
MQNADNLRVTAQARLVAQVVYEATRQFPSTERFGLAAQMRRAAISIGSNICEGCGRAGNRELTHFLQIAYGSVSELQFQVMLAGDLDLLTVEQSEPLADAVLRTKKMLARLISALRKRQAGTGSGMAAGK